MKLDEISPVYIVPFDKRYFLLGLSLLVRIKEFINKFNDVYVLDFGLTKKQIDFLEEFGVEIISTPQELIGAHAYKLKSNLIAYLRKRKLLDRWIVFLDADILLLKSPVTEINNLILYMAAKNNLLAICQDMGPAESISAFLKNNGHGATMFKNYTSGLDVSRPYCNIGFVIFSPQFNFYEFKYLADKMEGENCWEQNAINLMILEGLSHLLLDSKKWNLHGGNLLDKFSEGDDPFIIHLTSSTDNLVQGPFDLMVNEIPITFFYRYIKNKKIVELQRAVLNQVVTQYGDLLLKHLK